VTANCLHPGLVRTRFGNKHTLPHHSLLHSLLCLFGMAPAKGAQTSIYLASAAEVEGITGKYFVDRRPAMSSALSHDRELAGRLWQVSADLTGMPAD
jgi:hypothetical protein